MTMYTFVQGTRARDNFIVIAQISSNQLIYLVKGTISKEIVFWFLALLLVLYYCIHDIASLLPDLTISRV